MKSKMKVLIFVLIFVLTVQSAMAVVRVTTSDVLIGTDSVLHASTSMSGDVSGLYGALALNTSVAPTFVTVDTGHGAQEVYGQNTSVFVVQGNNLGVVMSLWEGLFLSSSVTIPTTMPWDNVTSKVTYNQNLNTTAAVTFVTIDTGQGANELYDMDQNVLTTSNVVHNNLTVTVELAVGDDIVMVSGKKVCLDGAPCDALLNATHHLFSLGGGIKTNGTHTIIMGP